MTPDGVVEATPPELSPDPARDTARVVPAIIGPFGPAQLTCLRSWIDRGYDPIFIHLAEDGTRLPFLERSVHGYLRTDRGQLKTDAGIARLSGFLADHGASGITALGYDLIEFLWMIRDRLPKGIGMWVADRAVLELLQSKDQQIALARDIGLWVAPTWHLMPNDLGAVPGDAYPLVLRPDDPRAVSPEFKVELVESREALATFVETLERVDRPLIAQPYIEGKNYLVHGSRSPHTGHCEYAAFVVDRMFQGVCLTVRRVEMPKDLETGCRKIAEVAGLTGVFHFDFRWDVDNERFVFLDINGRLGGTTGKVFRCGFDEPKLLVDAFRGTRTEPPRPLPRRPVTATNRLAMIKVLIGAVTTNLTVFDYPNVGLGRRLADLLPGFFLWKDEIWAPRHWKLAVAYYAQLVKRRPISFIDRLRRVTRAVLGA